MFFLINKPVGISSFRAISILRKRLGVRKVGHTGTLDPLASGLLLVATNGSTKLIPYIDKEQKTYIFTVRFDGNTDSLDLDTPIHPLSAQIIEEWRRKITRDNIEQILLSDFVGRISQIPPAYSAINHSGKRAYELARAGLEVPVKEREVEIFSIRLLEYDFPNATIETRVSAGTYVRSIARDLGKKLGLGGYVTMLHRSSVGELTQEMSYDVDDISLINTIPYEVLFPEFGILEVDNEIAVSIRNGIVLSDTFGLIPEKRYFVRHSGRYISLVEHKDGMVRICANDIE